MTSWSLCGYMSPSPVVDGLGKRTVYSPSQAGVKLGSRGGLLAIGYGLLAVSSPMASLSRRRLLFILLAAVFAALFFFPALIGLLTAWCCFQPIGYQVVFSRE